MIDRDALPPEVVEAAARVIYDRWRLRQGTPWEELGDSANYWRGWGKDALAAALAVGEVRQEHGVVPDELGMCIHHCDDRMVCTEWFPHVHNKTRSVVTWPDETIITTPWKDMNLGDGDA